MEAKLDCIVHADPPAEVINEINYSERVVQYASRLEISGVYFYDSKLIVVGVRSLECVTLCMGGIF